MVEFKYSDKGTPYIDMGDSGILAFSKTSAHGERGYRWLSYNKHYDEMIVIKKTVKGQPVRDIYEVPAHESCAFTFKMKRDYKGLWGVPRNTIPPRLVKFFIKTFDSLTEDDYFPFKNIKRLEKIIEKTNFKKVLSQPIKRKKRKVKKNAKPRGSKK